MPQLLEVFWIASFGALGVLSRYALRLLVPNYNFTTQNLTLPVSTWITNIIGSLLAGFLMGLMKERGTHAFGMGITFNALTVGFLGGFTTFSALATESLGFIESGHWGWALLYSLSTVSLGIAAAFLGLKFGLGFAKV